MGVNHECDNCSNMIEEGREFCSRGCYIFCLRKTPLLAVGMNQTLSQPKADEYAQVL